jgi:hypothetical protein
MLQGEDEGRGIEGIEALPGAAVGEVGEDLPDAVPCACVCIADIPPLYRLYQGREKLPRPIPQFLFPHIPFTAEIGQLLLHPFLEDLVLPLLE